MSKRTYVVLIAVGVLLAGVVTLHFGGGPLKHWLLALHGRH